MTYFGCKRCSKKDTVRYWFIDICWWYAKCKHWSIAHDCIGMNTFELGNSYWLAWALHLTLQIELFCDKQVCLFGQNSLKPMGNRLQTMVVTIHFFLYMFDQRIHYESIEWNVDVVEDVPFYHVKPCADGPTRVHTNLTQIEQFLMRAQVDRICWSTA